MTADSMPARDDDRRSVYWLLAGARGITSLPALILMTSFIGFSAFAVESGIPRAEAVFMTVTIWALPAKMILIGMIGGGANLFAAFLAVSLSSIRMMPMVASLVPELRTARTPVWVLLFLSHFVAITAWVYTTQTIQSVPRQHRITYFAGFGITLTLVNTVLVGVCYGLVASFPPLVAGTLYFLTPVYFVMSIWASARHSVVRVAFVIGIVGGPLFALLTPGLDILLSGVGGGTLAYLIDRFWLRGRRLAAAKGEAS